VSAAAADDTPAAVETGGGDTDDGDKGATMQKSAKATKAAAKVAADPAEVELESAPLEPESAPEAAPVKATKATRKSAPPTKAATKSAPAKASPGRSSPAKSAPAKAAPRSVRSADETEKIRVALSERRDELRTEYDQTMSEIAEAQRDRLTDSAGDDQADTGTKTFEREQEISLANNVRERITQVERALDRLDDGQYGWCERCGNAIPVERLAAFPSATLCVSCKQLEERR